MLIYLYTFLRSFFITVPSTLLYNIYKIYNNFLTKQYNIYNLNHIEISYNNPYMQFRIPLFKSGLKYDFLYIRNL